MTSTLGNKGSDLCFRAAEIAAQAVCGAITATGAQSRLDHALAPMLPALHRVAAQELARQIKSFVNRDRIDAEVTVTFSDGTEIITKEAGYDRP